MLELLYTRKTRSTKDVIFWTLYSAIALSSWSYYILSEFIGVPFFAYELYFLPLLIKYRRFIKMRKYIQITNEGALVCIMVLLCFIFGFVVNPRYIVAHITTFRTVFYYLVIINIFNCIKRFDLLLLECACLGAVIGDLIFTLTVGVTYNQVSISILPLALVVIIPIVENNNLKSVIYSLLAVILSFRSAFRINIVVVLISIACSLIYSGLICRKGKALVLLGLTTCVTCILIINFDTFVSFLVEKLHMSEYSLYRVTSRLYPILRGDFQTSQDSNRIVTIKRIAEEFIPSLFPKGLIRKGTDNYGVYKDTPFVFLYDAFGSVLAWVLVLFFISKMISAFYQSLTKQKNQDGIISIISFILIILLLLNGTFLTDTYAACMGAVVLGLLINRRCLRFQY